MPILTQKKVDQIGLNKDAISALLQYPSEDGGYVLKVIGGVPSWEKVVDGPVVLTPGQIVCGTSEAGDAVGFHGGPGVIEDLYGDIDTVLIGGEKLIQLRALNGWLRARLEGDVTPTEFITIKINGTDVEFEKEKNQPRYNAESASISALFIDGDVLDVEDGFVDETIEPPSVKKKSKNATKKK